MAGLLAVLTAFTTLIGMGTTAFAASETAESYMVSYPRDGDAVQVYDQSTWGHSAKTYMNGWSTQSSNVTTIHCMDSYDGKICYCIEPGVPRNVGDSYSGLGENFWDNYPSQYNNTIEPDDIKVLLGRIMQYGYSGCMARSSDCALYGKRFGELDPRVRNRDGKSVSNKALRGQRKNCPRFAFGLRYRHRCVPFHGAQLQTA